MKHITKRFFILLAAMCMFVSANTTALAYDSYGVTEHPDYLYHSEISIDGTSKPKSTWNVNIASYDFSGSAYKDTVYTNYKFKGKTSYTITVNNTGDGTLSVKAKTTLKTYSSTQVAAGESATISFSGLNKTDEFYIVFDGSRFSGTIK